MANMTIYEAARAVPEDAKKQIPAGKLKGFSNVNPMYRIKRLTEIFGPCGTGWWYEITNQRLQPVADGQIICFVDINLYYKTESGEDSKPIPGVGGNYFISSTRGGLQVSDECYKMALTDAISVAAKALGVGADVYWEQDASKYGAFGVTPVPDMYDYGYAPQQPQTYQPQAQPTAPIPAPQAYAPQPQAVAPQTPVQPGYTPAPQTPVQAAAPQAAPPSVPVTDAMTGTAQPPAPQAPQDMPAIITPEEARNVVCSVDRNAGRTLGDILTDPRGMDFLGYVERYAADPREKEAARVLRLSLIM